MPDEVIATPATIWVKAGAYKVQPNDGAEILATVPVHSRAMLVIPTATKTIIVEPKVATANFNDEPTDPPVTGDPPAQKHPSLLPCRYDGCDTQGGQELVDPLARVEERRHEHPPALRIGARLGVASSESLSPSVAAAARIALPAFDVALRLDGRGQSGYRELGFSAGLARVIAAPDAGWISIGAALRGDARTSTPMDVPRAGIGAAAELELALRGMPVTLGARYEQGISEIHDHAVVVELGVDWRLFN